MQDVADRHAGCSCDGLQKTVGSKFSLWVGLSKAVGDWACGTFFVGWSLRLFLFLGPDGWWGLVDLLGPLICISCEFDAVFVYFDDLDTVYRVSFVKNFVVNYNR